MSGGKGRPNTPEQVAERQAQYDGRRDAGMTQWQAAAELGLDPYSSGKRYERRYAATRQSQAPAEPQARAAERARVRAAESLGLAPAAGDMK